jgi:hypothetical protein
MVRWGGGKLYVSLAAFAVSFQIIIFFMRVPLHLEQAQLLHTTLQKRQSM